MELEIVLKFVKFGPHPRSNTLNKYDLNNGEANRIVTRQFKGEQENNTRECHILTPTIKNDVSGWKTVAKQSPGKLCGPACLRSTKQIVYPCERSMCWVVCPCAICGRGSKDQIILADKEQQFQDHQRYHHALHYFCDFCSQTPRFRHLSLIFGRKDPHPMFILLHVNVLAKQARVVSLHCNEYNLSFKVKADRMRHL